MTQNRKCFLGIGEKDYPLKLIEIIELPRSHFQEGGLKNYTMMECQLRDDHNAPLCP